MKGLVKPNCLIMVSSYGYRIEAPTTPGTIDVEALKAIGLNPGPKYQKLRFKIPSNITV